MPRRAIGTTEGTGHTVSETPAYVAATGPLSHFTRSGWLSALKFLIDNKPRLGSGRRRLDSAS